MNKNALKNKCSIFFIISIVIIIIFISLIYSGKYYFINESNNHSNNHNTPIVVIATTSFSNNSTHNSGGWKIEIASIENKYKWNETTIRIVNSEGYPLIQYDTLLNRENSTFYYSPSPNSSNPERFFYSTGYSFYYKNDIITPLNNSTAGLINDKELLTLQNISIAVTIPALGNHEYLSSGCYFILFKDNNGDGINEISSGYRIELINNNHNIASSILIS